MPGSTGVEVSVGTGSDGASTFETLTGKAAGKGSLTDALTSTGPYIYEDIVRGAGAGLGTISDVVDPIGGWLEVITGRAAGSGAELALPPNIYIEVVTGNGAGAGHSNENLTQMEILLVGKGGARGLVTDSKRSPISAGFFETLTGKAAGKGSGVDADVTVDQIIALAAARGNLGENYVWNEPITGKAAALGLNGSGQVITETGTGKAAGKGSGADIVSRTETITGKAAGKGVTLTDAQTFTISIVGLGAGKGSGTVQGVTVDPIVGNAAARGVPGDSVVYTLSITGLGAGSGAQSIVQAVTVDSVTGKGAGRGAEAESRVVIETLTGRAAGKATVTEGHVFVNPVTGTAAGRGAFSVIDRTLGIIPRLRQITKATLSEVLSIPEGLPNAILLAEIAPPFVCIIAEQSQGTPMAVNDATTTLIIRLVYCAQNARDSSTDTMQDNIRHKVDSLIDAVMADWTLQGNCTGLDLEETPLDKVQAYQQHFADNSQDVSVGVCSFRILVGRSLV